MEKGKFLNTSKKYVLKLLEKYNLKSQNLLIQSSFDNKDLRKKISDTLNHIDIFHYDCDQYEITVQALEISKILYLIKKFLIYYLMIGAVLVIKFQKHLMNFMKKITKNKI